jgi:hypothetical protein
VKDDARLARLVEANAVPGDDVEDVVVRQPAQRRRLQVVVRAAGRGRGGRRRRRSGSPARHPHSQRRMALSTTVSKTGSGSGVVRPITASTSAVARCCSVASRPRRPALAAVRERGYRAPSRLSAGAAGGGIALRRGGSER